MKTFLVRNSVPWQTIVQRISLWLSIEDTVISIVHWTRTRWLTSLAFNWAQHTRNWAVQCLLYSYGIYSTLYSYGIYTCDTIYKTETGSGNSTVIQVQNGTISNTSPSVIVSFLGHVPGERSISTLGSYAALQIIKGIAVSRPRINPMARFSLISLGSTALELPEVLGLGLPRIRWPYHITRESPYSQCDATSGLDAQHVNSCD